MKDLTRITTDPHVMGGKPCVRGLRVTVGTIVGLIAADIGDDATLLTFKCIRQQAKYWQQVLERLL